MSQFLVFEEREFDFEYCESSDHYQRVEAYLPDGVSVKTNITEEDLAYGLANARPVQL